MNEEKDLGLKDSEINKLTSDLTKASKREFGQAFKSAIGSTENDISTEQKTQTEDSEIEPANIVSQAGKVVQSDISESQVNGGDKPSENADKQELYSIVKPLRTYERDIAETIRNKNESVASINLAAQKKQIETGEKKPTKEKVEKVAGKSLTLIISFIMILSGLVFAFWLFYFFSMRQPTPTTVATPSIITTDEKEILEVSSISAETLLERINGIYRGQFGTSRLIDIEIKESSIMESRKISAERFFGIIAPGAPTSLARALGPDFVFGFKNSEPKEFFILTKVSSFNNSFDGMLRWERSMKNDLEKIFPMPELIFSVNEPSRNFEDLIIRNKDTRVLKDDFGNITLVYSFLDQENLLITTSESIFSEVLNRFFASKTAR